MDITPPSIGVGTASDTLWPPNHKLVDVGLNFSLADACDAAPALSLGVTSDEPADDPTGDGHHSPDARFAKNADAKVVGLRLRSEREGDQDGRVYLIQMTATDASGNSSDACAVVTVTRSRSKKNKANVAAQAAAALAACPAPLAHNVVGPPPDGPAPEIGPKQ